MLARQVAINRVRGQRVAGALAHHWRQTGLGQTQFLQSVNCRSVVNVANGSKGSNPRETTRKKPTTKNSTLSSFLAPHAKLKQAAELYEAMYDEAMSKQKKKYQPNVFKEFKQFTDMNGKVLEAAKEPIAVSKAVQVTPLKVKDLQGNAVDLQPVLLNGQTTLLLTSFKNAGLHNLSAWQQTFAKHFACNSRVQIVTLSIVEEWYMWLLKPLVRSNLAKAFARPEFAIGSVSEQPESFSQQPTDVQSESAALTMKNFVHFGWSYDFRTVFELNNSFVGYVHLIDDKGRIRWIAAGQATPEELNQLVQITQTLLQQSEQAKARKKQ